MVNRRKKRVEIKKLWDEDPAKLQLKKSKKRAVILITIIFFCFALISFRLIDLMILRHEILSQKAGQQYGRVKTLMPQRGVVWDRRMREMVVNIEADSLSAVPSEVEDVELLFLQLDPLIKISAKKRDILKKKKGKFTWLVREMDEDTSRSLNELRDRLGFKELIVSTESKRYYPKGETGAHVLGFTDIDNRGIAGIERVYDKYMKGKIKKVRIPMGRDARGNSLSEGVEDSIPGNNILLTIDESLQYIVEREIANAMIEWEAKAASAIMMNPMTGEILAMANMPTFDPNIRGKVPTKKNKKKYEEYWGKRRNRAITDFYEPGSTLKTFLAAAAFEERVVKLDDKFDVSKGYIVVGGKPIRDTHKHEIITFQEVIQKSSNVGAVQIGLKLGKEKYYSYLKRFGFGEKTGIDLPGEVRGILRRIEDWSGTSLPALSIGQEIGVTSLQILRAYSAIANGGLLMKPYIVSEIISSTGEVTKSVLPEVEREVISRATAETIRDILKTVVGEEGTGQQAYIKGNLVAGKTGTAQVFDLVTMRYSKDKYVSSFVGFVPADNPKIALIIVIYEPKGAIYGGTVAAPVFKKIIEHTLAYLDIPMEREENHILFVSQ